MKGRWSNTPSVPTMSWHAMALLAFLCAAHLQLHATFAAGLQPPMTATGRSLLGESDHKYSMGDAINLYANKVGPFHNPRFASCTHHASIKPLMPGQQICYALWLLLLWRAAIFSVGSTACD